MARYTCSICGRYETNKTSNFKRHFGRCIKPDGLQSTTTLNAATAVTGASREPTGRLSDARGEPIAGVSMIAELTATETSTPIAKRMPTKRPDIGRALEFPADPSLWFHSRLSDSESRVRELEAHVDQLESTVRRLCIQQQQIGTIMRAFE